MYAPLEAIAFIFELAVPRMAMRDLPTDIRIGDLHEREEDLKSMLENVRKDIDAFVDGAPQFDDLTMLVFRYF